MHLRNVVFLPLLFFNFCATSQNIKKVIRGNEFGPVEVFYINKKDKSYEGPYTLTSRSGTTLISGHYAGGQKDSVWTYYMPDHNIYSKQTYKKGVKSGVWEFYDSGQLSWIYNFDSFKVSFVKPEDSAVIYKTYPAFQDEQGNWIHFSPEQHALLITSDNNHLAAMLNYPEEAVNHNQQGQVNIAVLVDQQGNPETYEIGISSGYPSLDKEALRVSKLIHREYIPAENKGVKVKSIVLLQINFHLETSNK